MTIQFKREEQIASTCIALTLIALGIVTYVFSGQLHQAYKAHQTQVLVDAAVLSLALFFSLYRTFSYQFCLVGHYKRQQKHVATPHAELEKIYDAEAPTLTYLIPAYKEEKRVVWQTMLASALSEYPHKRVTVLIDDPYAPRNLEDQLKLEENRHIPHELQALFAPMREILAAELQNFKNRSAGKLDVASELQNLASHYSKVANWLEDIAHDFSGGCRREELPHAEKFFVEAILETIAAKHRDTVRMLRSSNVGGNLPDRAFLNRHYTRLASLFSTKFASFERKKYSNLSHEANKAMNLNSYISLMGKSCQEIEIDGSWRIQQSSQEAAHFSIPDADYLIILDADTIVLPDYSLRMVHEMGKPAHAEAGVMQTFPTAFPGCPHGIERIGGASIDMLFRVNQGHTHWKAGFWMGANAVVRKSALEDIRKTDIHNGHEVSVYIQDGTVIEDTETTMALLNKGWRIHNYPQRMAFFSSPPDFGSLLIQRRRWANGGLLLLPYLWNYIKNAPKNLALLKECLFRFDYLASTATGNAAALVIFFYPFHGSLITPWMALLVLPCLFLQMRTLKMDGYSYADALRLYAFDILLVPVIMGGVLKSLQQGITGKKIPFCRTPKIPARTAAPALYCLLELALPLGFLAIIAGSLEAGHVTRSWFAMGNVIASAYVLTRFIGVQAAFEDIFASPLAYMRKTSQTTAQILPWKRGTISFGGLRKSA